MSSIDIIVPCYRYGRYLRTCVESLLSQGVPDLRVLVIDDESPDETPEVARALVAADPRVFYTRHEKNRGHIATYNEGIDWLESDYMLLLSADDWLLPGALQRAMALMDARPDIAFTFGDATAQYDSGDSSAIEVSLDVPADGELTVLTGLEFIETSLRGGAINIVPTPTAIVRTALLKKVGGYDPALPHTGDLEMWLRLAAHGTVAHFRGPQAAYRMHSANMSLGYSRKNIVRDIEQRDLALETFVGRCAAQLPEPAALLKRFRAALAAGAVSMASRTFNDGDPALSREISDHARKIDPDVTRSSAWFRLTLKRLIGARINRLAQPAVARFRRSA